MEKKKMQHEESGLNSISNKGKIKTLIRILSKATNICAKIAIANRIYELGGTKKDILEAETKRVKKTIQ